MVGGLALIGAAVVLGAYCIRRHRAKKHALPGFPEMAGREAKNGWELDASAAATARVVYHEAPTEPRLHEAPATPVGIVRRAELG